MKKLLRIHTLEPVPFEEIPCIGYDEFASVVKAQVDDGAAVSSFFILKIEGALRCIALLSDAPSSELLCLSTPVINKEWHSLTKNIPQLHMFEREMAEQWGVSLKDHPWPKPVRFHKSWDNPAGIDPLPSVTDFYTVTGQDVHEVAVGPVHAGIIEPGHFRFQCHGEDVFHLEISLGYQHRGIEKALLGGPSLRSIYLMEAAAGDTTIGHTLAYCQNLEALSNTTVSPRAQAIRCIALELERCANHTGDLGALAQDVGFLPTSAYCGRLRGDFLNMSALICGSRFGRSLVRSGGVLYDLDLNRIQDLQKRLDATMKDLTNAVELLWETPSVLARLEGTGCLTNAIALQLGLVGPAARATGIPRDVRQDFPFGMYQFFHIPVSTWHTGDVFARAYVRWLEIQGAVFFIQELLHTLPDGPILEPVHEIGKNQIVVSMVEGWRGEICHSAITDDNGFFTSYKVVDPSFHNWTGLALALRNQQISDFPLCNKSFNLSYCGHDL